MAKHRREEIEASRGESVAQTADSSSVVRRSYAAWIMVNCPALSEASEHLAVAIHPWPDGSISEAVATAVIGELHPLANLHHHDVCEVAIERLMRIVEVAYELNCPSLAHDCLKAARALDAVPARPPQLVHACREVLGPLLSGRLNFPDLSLTPDASMTRFSMLPATQHGYDDDFAGISGDEDSWSSTAKDTPFAMLPIAALLLKVAATGSRDLGVLLGSDPTGFDVHEIIKCCPDLAPLTEFIRRLDSLPERDRDITTQRLFTFDRPPTLDSLGDRWGITRERARQIARKAEETLESEFGDDLCALGGRVLEPLHHATIPTEDLIQLLSLLAAQPSSASVVVAALLKFDGVWIHDNGWSMTSSAAGKLTASVDALLELADGYGSMSTADAHQYLGEHFLRLDHLERYLVERLGWVRVQDHWSLTGSKRNRIATALRAIGRPATKAEIAHAAGIAELNQISNHLSGIPNVVRADKDRWAYAGWVEDPYDGIVGEIEQRIDEHGGAVSFDLLLDEIPSRFGVSLSSVRTFVATDAFALEHGMVRRNEGEYIAGDPGNHVNATRVGGVWGQRVLLHQRHFEGYSLAVSFDIAFANGVRPGDDLKVPIAGSDVHASLIWQRHNPTRTVFIGRVSSALSDLGCAPGNEVVLFPSRDGIQISPYNPELHHNSTRVRGEESHRMDISRESPPSNPDAFQQLTDSLVRDPLLDILGDS